MAGDRSVSASDPSSVTDMIFKLLDKAGKDPRLTPRILREKAEQRLKLQKGDLRPRRDEIKNMIFKWWDQQQRRSSNKEDTEVSEEKIQLKALVRLARLSGKTPAVLVGLNDLSLEKKIRELRKRLREKGLRFSDPLPTEEEIEAAQQDYEKKKDMEGMDTSLILEQGASRLAKRKSEHLSAATSEINSGGSETKRPYVKAAGDDEEAEAEF